MANEEQLSILKQGVKVWNKWREGHPDEEIDLSIADLGGSSLSEAQLGLANLFGANLRDANMSRAYLNDADLNGAYLNRADLADTNLIGAHLSNTDLSGSNLNGANLTGANLIGALLFKADLRKADLTEAYLMEANLAKANLTGANLSDANLNGANFNESLLVECSFLSAVVGKTTFGSLDLSKAIDLDTIYHMGPSTIGTDTIAKSQGKIPEVFLQGCGLSDWEIEEVKIYNRDLGNEEINKILYKIYDLRATQALQVSPLFISYSHGDSTFVDKLESQLNKKGIRFWRDIHDMKAGRMEKQIDRAISQNRTVLLVLSENSIKSDWVEHEVRTARGLEKDMGRDVLCPVALDDSWKSSPWPKRVMEQIMEYNILDFSAWKDDDKFEGMFRKLIDGLELFYKG